MNNEPFETFLLYYFSAIAQVVAAVIALGGVFLVFYIQSLNKGILNWSEIVKNKLKIYYLDVKNFIPKADDPQIGNILFFLENDIQSENTNRICNLFIVLESLEIFDKNYNKIESNPDYKKPESFYSYWVSLRSRMNILYPNIIKRKNILSQLKQSFIAGSIVILFSLLFITISYFKILWLNIAIVSITFILTFFVLLKIYIIIETSFSSTEKIKSKKILSKRKIDKLNKSVFQSYSSDYI